MGKNNFGKISAVALLVVLFLSLALSVVILRNNSHNHNLGDFSAAGIDLEGEMKSHFIEPLLGGTVSAEELYPMFLCPCCNQALDKKNPCCGMAQERIDYIDYLVGGKEPSFGKLRTRDEIIFDYVKKYGSNSFADKNFTDELKKQLAAQAPKKRPIISFEPESLDLGNVSQKQGMTTAVFTLKNEGKKDLIINKLDTSCGCTSASIIYKGVEGPKFAMAGHGIRSPTDWSITVGPGETGQLKVYYDPNVHKDLRGWVVREIYIYSNDPVNFEKKVQIEFNQVD